MARYRSRTPADDAALQEIQEALEIAERSADDVALFNTRQALGQVLLHRGGEDYARGLEILTNLRDKCLQQQFFLTQVPFIDVEVARDRANKGDRAGALALVRSALDKSFDNQHPGCIVATDDLLQLLLDGSSEDYLNEAEDAIKRLASSRAGGLAIGERFLLRMQALLARARGEEDGYRQLRDRYREMAKSLGFEGHIAMAEAMR